MKFYSIFIKGITLWNWVSASYTNTTQYLHETYTSMMNYLRGHHSIWFFLDGHTLPLSMQHCSTPVSYEWSYQQTTNQLFYHTTNPTLSYSFSWLSAKIVVTNDSEYDMDPFLETFRVVTADHMPPLSMIFMTWCIYHKRWFPATTPISFHVIDNVGNEHVLSLSSPPILSAQHNKLYTSKN